MQEQIVLPVPWQEKWTRGLMYLGVGAGIVSGTLIVGPLILGALKTAFDIGMAALAFGGVAVALGVGGLIVFNVAPLVKNGIEVMAYKMWENMINAYPIVHMRLWRAMVLDGIEESKKEKKELAGILGENKKICDDIDGEISSLRTAITDKQTTAGTRDACTFELAGKLELREPYADVVESFTPAIEAYEQSIQIQQRYADKLSQEIEVTEAKWRADQSLRRGEKIWARMMGTNQAKVNSEAAKKRVEQQLGNSLGKLEDMRKQMAVLVQAASRKDEIQMANARKYMQEQMNAIDVPFVEVREVPLVQTRSLLKLT